MEGLSVSRKPPRKTSLDRRDISPRIPVTQVRRGPAAEGFRAALVSLLCDNARWLLALPVPSVKIQNTGLTRAPFRASKIPLKIFAFPVSASPRFSLSCTRHPSAVATVLPAALID